MQKQNHNSSINIKGALSPTSHILTWWLFSHLKAAKLMWPQQLAKQSQVLRCGLSSCAPDGFRKQWVFLFSSKCLKQCTECVVTCGKGFYDIQRCNTCWHCCGRSCSAEAAGPDLVSALLSAKRRYYSKLSIKATLEGPDWFTPKQLWDKLTATEGGEPGYKTSGWSRKLK